MHIKFHYFRGILRRGEILWFADVLQNRCSENFHKFNRKKPAIESLFNKVAGLKQVVSCKIRETF